jgi:hypothetical protein
MANTSVKRKLGWKMRSKAGMVDTSTIRDEPISKEVPRHLQNSEPDKEPTKLTQVEFIWLNLWHCFPGCNKQDTFVTSVAD